MSRAFFYARCSTAEQTTDNQLVELAQSGYQVESHRIHTEIVSGKIKAAERPVFGELLKKMERGDVLIVSRLDRLGRSMQDVLATIEMLSLDGIKVVCLNLGAVDLTSSSGKLQLGVLAAVAQFERDLLVERTQAGLQRAKGEGKVLGRRVSYTEQQATDIRAAHTAGVSIRELAKQHGLSIGTVHKLTKGGEV